jgi:hypothetical protein
MAITAVTGFTEPFQDTHPFYRGTYFRVVGRTAVGTGGGTSGVASGSAQVRLGQLTDFSFPYRFGGRFYLGVRAVLTVTATASGLGTASSVAQVLRQRQATGSGVGSETAVDILVAIRTATGSGVGTMDSTGLHIAPRTASGSGLGSDTTVGKITPVRTAQGSGTGDSAVTFIRVPLRTATGSGEGSGNGVDLVISLRTATGSGTGSATSLSGIAYFRSATGSGTGTQTADWVKSRIFRVPYTYNYPGGYFDDNYGSANRLQRYNRTGVRARNLYELTNGEYTIVDQRNLGQVKKVWLGGRDHFLTDAEVVELTAAGFGASIT